jgi:hypothetical protein
MPSQTSAQALTPAAFYWPEVELFPALQQRFAETGELDPLGFYAILDWKAARARTRHLERLSDNPEGFTGAVAMIAAGLRSSAARRDRLVFLMQCWKFRLPTASAILAVLYPDDFTVYDVRVCDVLGDFGGLGDKAWSENLWSEYERYLAAVRNSAPPGTSLRECDRRLWSASKRTALSYELDQRAAGLGPAKPMQPRP